MSGKPPRPAQQHDYGEGGSRVEEALEDQATESSREANKFQGGRKGIKGGDNQALNRNFKPKEDGGGSPGEDTGQGGLSGEGGGRLLR